MEQEGSRLPAWLPQCLHLLISNSQTKRAVLVPCTCSLLTDTGAVLTLWVQQPRILFFLSLFVKLLFITFYDSFVLTTVNSYHTSAALFWCQKLLEIKHFNITWSVSNCLILLNMLGVLSKVYNSFQAFADLHQSLDSLNTLCSSSKQTPWLVNDSDKSNPVLLAFYLKACGSTCLTDCDRLTKLRQWYYSEFLLCVCRLRMLWQSMSWSSPPTRRCHSCCCQRWRKVWQRPPTPLPFWRCWWRM